MRRPLLAAVAATALAVPLVPAVTGPASAGAQRAPQTATPQQYVVVYGDDASRAAADLAALGATVVRENTAVGVATVTTRNARFAAEAAALRSLVGVAPDRAIGAAPGTAVRTGSAARVAPSAVQRERVESRKATRPTPAAGTRAAVAGDEPLGSLQWDMRMVGATPSGSYRTEPGDRGVTVGIIDTGVDGSHPDIRPRFSRTLSRNFVTDIPMDPTGAELDGPCEFRGCVDPADHDDDGHGTHVASTIGSPRNGLGIAGVAPDVTLVNIRAGQDSGYFFLQPTIDALTYAGQAGIDVVNMSFFTDPWLYNCRANPADSPEEQAQQRTIIEATQRAVRYARNHGVTLVAAAGNQATDLGHPTSDEISPDYPSGAAHPRTVTNACLSMPTEAAGVLSVSSVGRTAEKSYFSNYGVEQTTVAAPGGDFRTGYGTPYYRTPGNLILAAYPRNVGVATGDIDPVTGAVTPQGAGFVLRDCERGSCGYYQYLQGTSMAAPHAVGVAALVVSRHGVRDRVHGGLTLAPATVEDRLEDSAAEKACPRPRLFRYADPELADYRPYCEGTRELNGFFGHGIVSAAAAASGR